MNHRLGFPALAAFLAGEHDSMYGTPREYVTPPAPRRHEEVQALHRRADAAWFDHMRRNDGVEAVEAKAKPAPVAHGFKVGDRVRWVGHEELGIGVVVQTPADACFPNDVYATFGASGWGLGIFSQQRESERLELIPSAPSDDGWLPWRGGNRPVGPMVKVVYRMRCGSEWITPRDAGELEWSHYASYDRYDIVAYRIAPQ